VPAVAAVALLAGCGGSGGPKLARSDAQPLIALAHRISTEGACAQARDIPRLQDMTIALVNRHRVPRALQEDLMAGANALSLPPCLPTIPAASPAPAPAPTVTHRRKEHHDHHHDKHGHGD
jgi:hypothetical protein